MNLFRLTDSLVTFLGVIVLFVCATTSNAQSVVAYRIAPGTLGTQGNFNGALGMDFLVNGSITLDELGVFDSAGDGLLSPITVEFWSRNDGGTPDDPIDDFGGAVLATASFGPGDDGTLNGGSRFKPVDPPLELTAGAYTIVAYGYSDIEPNYNTGGAPGEPELTTIESPSITFVGSSRFGATGGLFPDSPDGGLAQRYGAGTFSFTAEDSDQDGMPDVWEDQFGLNKNNPADANEDTLDMDGLDNLEEFQIGTDPTDADSDDDNLEDGQEVNVTGTDPNDADSDDDDLTDNVETNTDEFKDENDTGTDPNDPDSDGDTFSDGVEVAAGTDPNDPTSAPNVVETEGTIAYLIPGGALGNQGFGTGLGMDFDVGETPIRVTSFGVFDDASDGIGAGVTLSVSLWERDPANDAGSLGQVGPTIEFTNTTAGELIEGSRFKPLDEPIELPSGFQGSIVAYGFTAGGTDQNGNDGGVGNFPYPTDDGDGLITFVGTTRFGAGGVGVYPDTPDGGPVNRYGAGNFIFDTGPTTPFEITNIIYDAVAGEISLTWNSRPGRFYAIDASDDLQAAWGELDDSIPATGDSTTYVERNITPGKRRRFYRVREQAQ
jgi:hypothetical protein